MNQKRNPESEGTERTEDAQNPERASRAERAMRAVNTDKPESTEGRPTLMQTTPGTTAKRFARDPLATEAEATPGPDHINPFRSERERRIVEEIERAERERQDGQLFKTGKGTEERGPRDSPLLDPPGFWDTDQSADLPGLQLAEFEETVEIPDFDPFEYDGPRF